MNLFMIGYRCTGKTTVGKAIGKMTGRAFLDTDTLLIQETECSINKFVETEGWENFRRKECSIIKRVCTKDGRVVATGGGVVLDTHNVEAMKKNGVIVWLRATPQTIRERLLRDENTQNLRPALTHQGLVKEIEEMLFIRHPYYESAADFYVHTDAIPVVELAQKIIHKTKI